ncbi:hypothetical protein [Methylobacterium trifolii]|uniref:3',5'-cyclic-nucleotide phosphodiesterase n=1 Tax=Methylobacterium trifolii TaxID=1003092 RepID=A0ABQ4TZ22_9HYPH|nr:hypothetical protein [Methylobacterium trifolii]GJE60159.1 hypothetical protein MPOCJGCO_2269 [Methylobacterium trifolii]
MKQRSVIAILSLLTLTAPAYAEATSAQRAACTPDVWRLCASEIPDVGAIKLCLRREKPRLSAGCRTVMDAAEKPVQTAARN